MKRFLIALVVFVILAGLCFGPRLLHSLYRAATPESVMQSNLKEYARLASEELHLTGTAKIDAQKKRYRLFLWFHARGFPIDEGDGAVSFWQPWSDLIGYWEGDHGSGF
jgi:hypothetical protein